MHNTLMQENQVRGVYIPIEIKPGTLGPALESLPKLGFKGVNLTMPLKQEAIATIDELDPVGKLMGAVSCIVVKQDNSLFGVNNDWVGFRDNLNATFPDWKSKTTSALVLGAGGGGLAIVYALIQEGVEEIVITNRSQERAEKIADIFKDQNISVRPWGERHSLVAETDLIVNTTNQGMAGQAPLDLSLELAQPDGDCRRYYLCSARDVAHQRCEIERATYGRRAWDAAAPITARMETLVRNRPRDHGQSVLDNGKRYQRERLSNTRSRQL